MSSGPRHRIAAAGVAALLFLGAATDAQALPPYWQRLRDPAIVDSNDLAEKLHHTPIDRIDRPSEDLYRIQAGPCTLDIRIVDDPAGSTEPSMPSPRRFPHRGRRACLSLSDIPGAAYRDRLQAVIGIAFDDQIAGDAEAKAIDAAGGNDTIQFSGRHGFCSA